LLGLIPSVSLFQQIHSNLTYFHPTIAKHLSKHAEGLKELHLALSLMSLSHKTMDLPEFEMFPQEESTPAFPQIKVPLER
jgi:hypothetical protein